MYIFVIVLYEKFAYNSSNCYLLIDNDLANGYHILIFNINFNCLKKETGAKKYNNRMLHKFVTICVRSFLTINFWKLLKILVITIY